MSKTDEPRPPLPPFDLEGAAQKVRMAEVVPGVIIGGQIGPVVSSRISQHTLERGLAALFIIVAALMLGEVVLRSYIH